MKFKCQIIYLAKLYQSKKDGSFDLISIGHRNHQGLFYYTDEFKNQFVINSEHGPKGGDEININNLKDNKVQNFDGQFLPMELIMMEQIHINLLIKNMVLRNL